MIIITVHANFILTNNSLLILMRSKSHFELKYGHMGVLFTIPISLYIL